jgi:DNA-binding GntR family transcriptional regulator
MTPDAVALRYRLNRRQQLPEEVAGYVRELIITGAVRPGEFLRMERIAEAVGVSNTPVREGLLILRSEGLVELVPRRGFVVSPFSPQDVRDLFWAQAQLASELAARAAKKITPERLAELEVILARYESAVAEDDPERIGELGHLFHRQINLAADSHRLALLLSSFVRQLPNRFYAAIETQASMGGDDHQRLMAALRRSDARAARSLMARHILARGDYLLEILHERGLWNDQDWDESKPVSR